MDQRTTGPVPNGDGRRDGTPVGPGRAPEKMWLSDLSIRRPHFITMVMVAVIVVGSLLYSRMGLDLFPDVSFPIVAVRTVYPGASPSEVERSVSKPIEDAVASLNGVETVRSTSMDSLSIVVVEFKLERDAKVAADEVRARVSAIRNTLPAGAKEPVIERFDPSAAPILSFAISDTSGRRSPERVRALVDDTLKARVEKVPGVAAVSVTGGLVREIHVDLQRDRLLALGVTPQQVVQAIGTETRALPGGRVEDAAREQLVRTAGEFRSLDEVASVPIPTQYGATRVRELATVSDGFAEVRALARSNGQDAVVATVQKQSGTNTVTVAADVKRELERIEADYPELRLVVVADQSTFTKEAVNDTQGSMVLGGLLAVVVVFAFFRDWRNTLVTVIGLPMIVLGTFAVMYMLGMGLNMVTLLALSVSVGMLIDDAIVVRENIFRHTEGGEDPRVAAGRGAAEIALAVLATTSTIIAVFLPIAFTGGIVGRFLRDFGLTVAIAVSLSLVEAFTIGPMLSAYLFRRVELDRRPQRAVGRLEFLYDGVAAGYRRLLGWALEHRWRVLGVGVGLFVASLAIVPLMTKSFAPVSDQGEFAVTIELPGGARLADTDRIARQVEGVLMSQAQLASVFTTVGSADGAVEKASINVKLGERAPGVTQRAIAGLRRELERAAEGNKVSLEPTSPTTLAAGSSAGAIRGRPIQFNVQGPDATDLDVASLQIMEAIRPVPGAVDIDRSIKPGKPSLDIVVDRLRAADSGVSTAQVGNTVRALVNGETAAVYRTGDKDVDIVVRLQQRDREPQKILDLPVTTPRGGQIPLSAVARVVEAAEPAIIERQDRQRQVVVGASYQGRDQGVVLAGARAEVSRLQLPPSVTVKLAGQGRFTDETFSSLGVALALSVMFVYMILASQFGSFVHPLTIMLALPFSVIGALLGLFVAGKPLDMMGMIGIILLMGLVTKNSILLVDFTNQLRQRGYSVRDALLEAGPIRLRPILMTTLAMIFGMLPVAAAIGAGSEFRQPMGIAVVCGLITSTVLTLVAVPVAYTLVDDAVRLITRRRRPAVAPSGEPAPAAEPARMP